MEEIAWNIETYETSSGEKVVDEFILHGFKKQTQQIPRKHLDTALERMRSLTII